MDISLSSFGLITVVMTTIEDLSELSEMFSTIKIPLQFAEVLIVYSTMPLSLHP